MASEEYKLERQDPDPIPQGLPPVSVQSGKAGRVKSLDAYRGLIMIVLAGGAFGLRQVAAKQPADASWQQVAFQFSHPQWNSLFGWCGVAFWDLIQPAFMFMVGVAVPFSLARRRMMGQARWRRGMHCAWRCLALVGLGVFLSSTSSTQTRFEFTNVLSQIGLGYGFVYFISGYRVRLQVVSLFGILLLSWGLFMFLEPTRDDDFNADQVAEMQHERFKPLVRYSPWVKGDNFAATVDRKLLNLFPRPDGKAYEGNGGGYQTLNFLPSIGTMLLGLLAGGLLQSRVGKWKKLMYLVLAGGACMAIALPMGWFLCPVVKRIWTPSWVLFSGAWVLWGLAIFYLLFDLLPLRWLAFPMVVVGMNSLVMYMMGQLLRPWITRMMSIHLDWLVNSQTTFGKYVPVYEYGTALLAMWLICYWMYRKKLFVRV